MVAQSLEPEVSDDSDARSSSEEVEAQDETEEEEGDEKSDAKMDEKEHAPGMDPMHLN